MFLVPMTRGASDLVRHFDRLFDGSLDRLFPVAAAPTVPARSPALDVAESEQAYTVTLDLPGIAKDDVKVSIEGRRVRVEARAIKADERRERERVLVRERADTSCSRSFVLPGELDPERSSAKLDNGVLKLELAKRQRAQPTRIAVN